MKLFMVNLFVDYEHSIAYSSFFEGDTIEEVESEITQTLGEKRFFPLNSNSREPFIPEEEDVEDVRAGVLCEEVVSYRLFEFKEDSKVLEGKDSKVLNFKKKR